MTKKLYIISKNLVFKAKKYEIGKIYHLVNKNVPFKSFNDINPNNIFDDFSIYEIKIDKKNNFFKILKEINYSKFLKSNNKIESFISALKNRDELSLSKFSNTKNNLSIFINVFIKNEKFINKLNSSDGLRFIHPHFLKLLHDKYIKSLVNGNHFLNHISYLGIPKYLDQILIQNEDLNYGIVYSVLRNGRKKDIEKYIHNPQYKNTISLTDIDRYLDELIIDKSESILFNISNTGRKKDLDILVKSKSERIRSTVAYHGYDEHLDMLVNDESKLVLQSVLDIGRKKDIDILRKSPIANELNFPKIE